MVNLLRSQLGERGLPDTVSLARAPLRFAAFAFRLAPQAWMPEPILCTSRAGRSSAERLRGTRALSGANA
jgi:hypothetical protein